MTHRRAGLSWLCFLLAGALPLTVHGQSAATPAATSNSAGSSSVDEEDEPIVLSPFEVSAEEDIGYYVSNTLSGSRMNTRLEDLASSITVVTPQQLIDTASTDINDVFRYESNTEGTHTYTQYSIDRFGGLSESIQMAPQTSNRIRGIGSPDRAVDYFVSISQIPIDAYNIDRLTINRGPNSILYGLGSASGLVNSSWARARIDAPDSTHLEFRLGENDDHRAVFRHERTLIEDTLAVKFATLFHDRGFRQKPSHEETRRYYGTVTYRPFYNTTVRAFYEHYDTDYRRPNSQTPQDFITQWRVSGSPTFNPSTMTITRNGTETPLSTVNGTTVGGPSGGGLELYPFNTRPSFLTNNGEVYRRMQNQIGAPGVLPDGTTFGLQPEQVLGSAGFPLASPLFVVRGLNDKSIYDWDSINLLSTNFGRDKSNSYQVTVEQRLFDNLFIEAAWRREKFESFTVNAQSGRTNGVRVDVNETLLDGTANPFFLQPFTETWEPTAFDRPQENESMRASATYELDFSENDNWSRWLGRHNLLGFAERREIDTAWYRWREAVISENDWAAAPGVNKFGSTIGQDMHRVYYLGEDGVVTHAPGNSLMLAPAQYGRNYPEGVIGQQAVQSLRYFVPTLDSEGALMRDGDTDYPVAGGRLVGEWVTDQATYATLLHDAEAQQTHITSAAAVLQSYLWDDRIVTTLGWRRDTRKARFSEHPAINDSGFRSGVPDALRTFEDPWDEVSGNTRSAGVVVKPFRNWSSIENAAQDGNFLASTLHGLSFYYNESDTFAPAGLEQNLFLETLPLPTGDGEDYGVNFSFLDNKLVVRLNWYKASQANARSGGDTGTITWRTRRMENEGDWGFVDMVANEIELREGFMPGTLNPWDPENIETAPFIDEIAERSGLSVDFLHQSVGFNDSRTISSEGMEIGLDFNPSDKWSFKFTAGKQETIESESAPNTQRWIWGSGTPENPEPGSRLDLWQQAMFTDQTTGELAPWWTTHWPGQPSWGFTPRDWYIGVVEAPMRKLIAQQGTASPQQAKWRWSLLGNYRFTDGPLRGLRLGGSVRWEDKKAIGYYGLTNPNTGEIDQYDVSRPIWDPAQEYVDLWASYTTRVWEDKVRMTVQVNVSDVFESGGLRAVGANPDGTPSIFRILEPRRFFLTTTFDF